MRACWCGGGDSSGATEVASGVGVDAHALTNPKVLRDLIENKVLEYRDPEIFADAINKEMNYKEILQRVADNWETL